MEPRRKTGELRLGEGSTIQMPAPTAWPMIMAMGLTLSFAGIVTSVSVSAVGVVLFVAGAAGWFAEVLPIDHHEAVAIKPGEAVPAPVPVKVEQLQVGEEGHRARLPLEIYPYSAGVKGGIAGGIVMAILASLEGLIMHGSPWYTINILAATVNPDLAHADMATLCTFDPHTFAQAVLIHGVLSLLMGLLYGILLPMFPRNPAFVGGLVAPLLWTSVIWATLDVLNPVLDQRIEWGGFIICQIAFGLMAGLVTARYERISTFQHLPLAVRSGIEAAGVGHRPGRE
jgi:hypothetical protein